MNSRPNPFVLSTACLIGTILVSSAVASPTISKEPSDASVSLGATVTFQVTASGASSSSVPLSYQWRFNDLQLLSSTNRSLILTNVQVPNAGAYTVVVADSSGSLTSRVARLEVDSTFTKITVGRIVNDGGGSLACAWGDYDNDGFLDLFVTNTGQRNYLYRNNRDGTFTRITAGTIATDSGNWWGCTWVDFDNDGNLDLLAARSDEGAAQAVLYRNNGDGTFTRTPAKTIGGIVPAGAGYSYGPVWADYDNDGFVDLFVARGGIDWLYHNDGNGSFTSVTNSLVGTVSQDSYFAAWVDYNNDGRPDLLVPVFSNPLTNRLALNLGGGAFEQITSNSIVDGGASPGGGAWGDYDNDGYPDLFLGNGSFLSGGNNMLYHNNGDGTFTRMTSDVVGSIASDAGGVDQCAWGDYDNDGFLDLFVTTTVGLDGQNPGPNYLYHNNGDGSFTRILTGSPVNDVGASVGCAWGDYDNDGFLDLFVAKGGVVRSENNALYRNNGNSNNWLKVKCVGTLSNRSAIGAKVRAKATIGGKAVWQLREINGGSSWTQNALDPHFGLGNATNVDILRIEWPSGIVQTLTNVAPKQFLTVVEHQENATGPIRFTAAERLTTGAIQLSASGALGSRYLFEASTNLFNWTKILALTNVNGTVEFLDLKAPNFNRRFFRSSAP